MPAWATMRFREACLIALVGELRQGRIQHPFLFVRRQVPKSREGRFFIHDQLVISNPAGNCQAFAVLRPNSLDNSPPP